MEQDMLNENSSELNWRDKLDDMDSLPGEILPDKNAVWEKLHGRLHQQPRRVKPLWYWAAAACLLMAVILSLLTTNKKQDMLVKNIPAKSLLQHPVIPPASASKESVMITVPSTLNKKVIISQPKIKIDGGQSVSLSLVSSTATVPNALAKENKQKEIPATMQITTITPVTETAVENTIAAIPARKKLKVVHINELGDPVEEARNILPPADYATVKIMLINQQVYTVSSIPSNSIGFNVSKTINTQPN